MQQCQGCRLYLFIPSVHRFHLVHLQSYMAAGAPLLHSHPVPADIWERRERLLLLRTLASHCSELSHLLHLSARQPRKYILYSRQTCSQPNREFCYSEKAGREEGKDRKRKAIEKQLAVSVSLLYHQIAMNHLVRDILDGRTCSWWLWMGWKQKKNH